MKIPVAPDDDRRHDLLLAQADALRLALDGALKAAVNPSVLAARALVAAYGRGGAEASPLAVSFSYYNHLMWRRVRSFGIQSRSTTNAWLAEGGYAVNQEFFAKPGAWHGHLVVVLDRRWLLDLTAYRADRPSVGLLIGPVVGAVDRAFIHGGPCTLTVELPTGSAAAYAARPAERAWRQLPEWRERALWKPHSDSAFDAIRSVAEGQRGTR